MEIIGTIILFLVITLTLIAYSSLSWGFVMFKFWYWFILPVFPMLPQINFWQAVGLAVFIMLLKNHTTQRSIKEEYLEDGKWRPVITGLLMPWMAVFTGWIIYSIWLS